MGAPARFEFRCFAPDFGASLIALSRDATFVSARESVERYLLWRELEGWNVKYREERLEIKVLRGRSGRLEQWEPIAPEDPGAHATPLPPVLQELAHRPTDLRPERCPWRCARSGARTPADHSGPSGSG